MLRPGKPPELVFFRGRVDYLLARNSIRYAARNNWDDSAQRKRVVGSRRKESLRLLSGFRLRVKLRRTAITFANAVAVRSAWRTRTQVTNPNEFRPAPRPKARQAP